MLPFRERWQIGGRKSTPFRVWVVHMRQKLAKLCKRIIDFAKGVTLIEIFVTVCTIAIVIGIKSCADRHDPGYVVTDRKPGECFLFRYAEWA